MPKLNVDAKMAKVVGKILSDPKFRGTFSKNPEATLKRNGIEADAAMVDKLTKINSELIRKPNIGGSAITVSSIG